MAGPWFTVQKQGKWETLDRIWISDGTQNIRAKLELKIELENPDHE